MTTTINNENQAAHNRRVLANKGDVLSSLNVEDFAVPRGKDGEWKFMSPCKPRGLHNGTAADLVATSVPVETVGQDGVVVDVVKRNDERLGHAGTPTDRVAAQAHSNFGDAHVVIFAKNSVPEKPVVIDIDGPGEDNMSYGHIATDVQSHAEVICVINYRDSGAFVDNIEFVIGNGAKLSVMTMVNRNEDTVHDSVHHIRVGRDVMLHHTVATLGSEVVRIVPCVAFTASGGDADLLGVYLADAGQYFENRMLIDHAVLNCRSSVTCKGALQGEPNAVHREARTAWVGDVLIRVEVIGTDTYELNRNLLLTEGTRANAVPNLEAETDEIVGAGHAATVGCSGEEQLFYLPPRGVPELAARRPVVRGFFSEVINLIPVGSVHEKLEKLVDEELNTTGF